MLQCVKPSVPNSPPERKEMGQTGVRHTVDTNPSILCFCPPCLTHGSLFLFQADTYFVQQDC